ncbi:unnamed protein product, partial [Nesidiocoris tenuis]
VTTHEQADTQTIVQGVILGFLRWIAEFKQFHKLLQHLWCLRCCKIEGLSVAGIVQFELALIEHGVFYFIFQNSHTEFFDIFDLNTLENSQNHMVKSSSPTELRHIPPAAQPITEFRVRLNRLRSAAIPSRSSFGGGAGDPNAAGGRRAPRMGVGQTRFMDITPQNSDSGHYVTVDCDSREFGPFRVEESPTRLGSSRLATRYSNSEESHWRFSIGPSGCLVDCGIVEILDQNIAASTPEQRYSSFKGLRTVSIKKAGLNVGDMILAVNKDTLVGSNYDQAAALLKKTEGVVTLVVCNPNRAKEDEKKTIETPTVVAGGSTPTALTPTKSSIAGTPKLAPPPGSLSPSPSGKLRMDDDLALSASIVAGTEITIDINKDKSGLGFSIIGGADTLLGSVIVQEVFPGGSAAKDGRLRAGDIILEMNGEDLRNALHSKAHAALHQTVPKYNHLLTNFLYFQCFVGLLRKKSLTGCVHQLSMKWRVCRIGDSEISSKYRTIMYPYVTLQKKDRISPGKTPNPMVTRTRNTGKTMQKLYTYGFTLMTMYGLRRAEIFVIADLCSRPFKTVMGCGFRFSPSTKGSRQIKCNKKENHRYLDCSPFPARILKVNGSIGIVLKSRIGTELPHEIERDNKPHQWILRLRSGEDSSWGSESKQNMQRVHQIHSLWGASHDTSETERPTVPKVIMEWNYLSFIHDSFEIKVNFEIEHNFEIKVNFKIKVDFEIKLNFEFNLNFEIKVNFKINVDFEIKVNFEFKLNFEINVNFEIKVDFEIKVNFEFKLNFEIDVNFEIKVDFEIKINFEFKLNLEFKLNFEIKVNFEFKLNFEIKLNFEFKLNFEINVNTVEVSKHAIKYNGERVVWEIHQVTLNRLPGYGFGIAVSGGRDNPHFTNGDPSIAISDVLKAGPAEGKLLVNDRIMSANGISLDGVEYATAVQVLRDSGNTVQLVVRRRVVLPTSPEPQTIRVQITKSRKKDDKFRSACITDQKYGSPTLVKFRTYSFMLFQSSTDYGIALGSKIYVKDIGTKLDGNSLQEGDVLLKINNHLTDGMSLKEAKKMIESSKEKLNLLVRRETPRSFYAAESTALQSKDGNYMDGVNNYTSQNVYVQPPTRLQMDDKSNLAPRNRNPGLPTELGSLERPSTPASHSRSRSRSEDGPDPPRPPPPRTQGRNNQEVQKGIIPNKARAEELATAQFNANKKEASNSESRGSFFRRRRISHRRSKSLSKDHWDDVVFGDSVSKFPAYERVVLRHPGFMRPVVLFGAVADLAQEKLLKDFPDKFSSPHLDSNIEEVAKSAKTSGIIRLSAIREIMDRGKHALLDITPNAVDRLNYAQFYPIVIFLRAESKHVVKEMRAGMSKAMHKSSKKLFEQSQKVEKSWGHVFSATVQLSSPESWYRKVRELIDKNQTAPVWMSEAKPEETLADDFLFPMGSLRLSYASSPESDLEATPGMLGTSPGSPRLVKCSSDPSIATQGDGSPKLQHPPPYSPPHNHAMQNNCDSKSKWMNEKYGGVPPELPPRIDRAVKPPRMSNGGQRSAQERLFGNEPPNYINAAPQTNQSSLDRHYNNKASSSYDSVSSYDSYNQRLGLGPNAHDDLKSCNGGPGSPQRQGQTHDPYRFTRSTQQPVKALDSPSKLKPADYPKFRVPAIGDYSPTKPVPPAKPMMNQTNSQHSYKPIPPPKPKNYRPPHQTYGYSTNSNGYQHAKSYSTTENTYSSHLHNGINSSSSGKYSSDGLEMNGHGSSLERSTYGRSGGHQYYYNVVPSPRQTHHREPSGLDLVHRADQRGSAFELYKKPTEPHNNHYMEHGLS